MNADTDKIKAIQAILGVTQDGVFGPKSQTALFDLIHLTPMPPVGSLSGDGSWPWIKARIDGEDIVIEPGIVTAFGGAHDTSDSGATASGLSTRDNPSYIGCALPMRRNTNPQLRGSPIPKLPWQTEVIFTAENGLSVYTKLIDEGPAKWTKHIGDLTVAAAKTFDPAATANNFERTLSIRIVGGAKFL